MGDKFLKNFYIFDEIFAIPSYIAGRNLNYDNKGDE
jgi:hypothetical protein